MKVMTVLGTRPEAIKLAPVIRELRRRAVELDVEPIVCVTAQHRQLLDQVLHLFEIVPDHDLEIMTDSQTPNGVTAAVVARLEQILLRERPDWVVVQGDTTSAMAAAIAAFNAGIRVAHVEAGLRSFDKRQPFPEEVNRRLIGVIADLHFAPTDRARTNLLREGVPDGNILLTGNPVVDALLWAAARPFDSGRLGLAPAILSNPDVRLILVTAHRRESFGKPLESICLALRDISERGAGSVHIAYAVHPNPRVQQIVRRLLTDVPHVTLLPPLDYLSLVNVLKRAYLVLTDSGGIQEEAPALGLPVLVLREVTERPEAAEAGTSRVIGTDRERIVRETMRLLEDGAAYRGMAHAVSPYGDGHAAVRIVEALARG